MPSTLSGNLPVDFSLSPRRTAVIIGVNECEDPRIPNLNGPRNDAYELSSILRAKCGFTIDDERQVLIGKNATHRKVRMALGNLFLKQSVPHELVVFYYSGHAVTDAYNNSYLVPYDFLVDEPYVSGLRLTELNDMLNDSRSETPVLIILDCVFSGFASDELPVPRSTDVKSERGQTKVLSFEQLFKGASSPRRLVLTGSGSEILTVHEGNKRPHEHGPLTFRLLDGLEGKASGADGTITLASLMEYVERFSDSLQYFSSSGSISRDVLLTEIAHKDIFTSKILERIRNIIEHKADLYSIQIALSKLDAFSSAQDQSNSNLVEIRRLVSAFLNKEKLRIGEWIARNTEQLRKTDKDLFQQLSKLNSGLSYTSLTEMNYLELCLMNSLIEAASRHDMKLDSFVRMCRSCYLRYSASQIRAKRSIRY
jgi:hypothetical protein